MCTRCATADLLGANCSGRRALIDFATAPRHRCQMIEQGISPRVDRVRLAVGAPAARMASEAADDWNRENLRIAGPRRPWLACAGCCVTPGPWPPRTGAPR